ncbi:MAG: NusG domain II-containing protein [Mariprofundaceae bacterium]|nr:NusG domain II-containing protein [Mariprofundaceae bacterium]
MPRWSPDSPPYSGLFMDNPGYNSLRQAMKGTWADRFLLILILIGIGLSWQFVHMQADGGEAMVTIYHGQTQLAQYPLHTQKPVHFMAKGELGDSEIVIDGKGVYFLESPCRNKLCILAGHKHKIGDMIACVPNRILVAINGTAKRFDAVVE